MMKDSTIYFIKNGDSVRFKIMPSLLDITDDEEEEDDFMTNHPSSADFICIDIPEGQVPY